MRVLGPTPTDVAAVVAELTGYDLDDLTNGVGQGNAISKARAVGYWCCRRFGASYPEIGRAFKRDHTTVMHGVQRVENDRPLLLAALAVVDVVNARHAPAPEPLFLDVP